MLTARSSSEQRTLVDLLDAVSALRADVLAEGKQIVGEWGDPIERASFVPSAANLAHYLALRHRDLRSLQVSVMPWGISSLGRLESRVMPTLDAVVRTLGELLDGERPLACAWDHPVS